MKFPRPSTLRIDLPTGQALALAITLRLAPVESRLPAPNSVAFWLTYDLAGRLA
jgi:hypothetical protein